MMNFLFMSMFLYYEMIANNILSEKQSWGHGVKIILIHAAQVIYK